MFRPPCGITKAPPREHESGTPAAIATTAPASECHAGREERQLVVRKGTVEHATGKQFKAAAKKTEAAAMRPDEPSEDPVSCFPSSRLPGPAGVYRAIHAGPLGGCEIRIHSVRDELWKEDENRSGSRAADAGLSILQVASPPLFNPQSGGLFLRPDQRCARRGIPATTACSSGQMERSICMPRQVAVPDSRPL